MPSSPPETPAITRSFTTSGALVDAVVLAGVGHLDIPEELAGEAMQREQVRVVGDHEHAVAEHGDAAIDAAGGVAGQTLACAAGCSARSRGRCAHRARRPR